MSKPVRKRSLADNEAKAVTRSIRISPRKLNELATIIRGMKVVQGPGRTDLLAPPHCEGREEDAGVGDRQRREQP